MQFFTANDVLRYIVEAAPDDPVTIHIDDSILEALEIMLENDFDQLPVISQGGIQGTVTYKSIAKYIKWNSEPSIGDVSVKIVLNTNPRFVSLEHDIFELLQTLAEDDYVLIGDRDGLSGILTRYDVLYFIKHQVEPFLKIGEIEESLRSLLRESIEDWDQCIEDTFADRIKHDERFDPPERIEDLKFSQYQQVMMKNLDKLPSRIEQERDMIVRLLEDVRESRNALFHFRAEADEVDRIQLDSAHSYFTGIANTH